MDYIGCIDSIFQFFTPESFILTQMQLMQIKYGFTHDNNSHLGWIKTFWLTHTTGSYLLSSNQCIPMSDSGVQILFSQLLLAYM